MNAITRTTSADETLDRLEVAIAQMPAVELLTEHLFGHKCYARILHIPAGTALTGKPHRFRTINVLLKGKIEVAANNEAPRMLEAPAIFVAEAGARRAGLVHEDVTWVNIHGTEETDLEKIEAEQIIPHTNPMLDYQTRRIL